MVVIGRQVDFFRFFVERNGLYERFQSGQFLFQEKDCGFTLVNDMRSVQVNRGNVVIHFPHHIYVIVLHPNNFN